MAGRTHNERCPDCKQAVTNLLTTLFNDVKANWDLGLPCRLEDFASEQIFESLGRVNQALRNHRGFQNFVKYKKLPRVDYFIPNHNFIVEFDESQHFTEPRDISLGRYPQNEEYGFSIDRWRDLCRTLNKRDNDPPYRDEQRAWYDTLRDFAPKLLGTGKTIRLYSRDQIWCSLDPNNESDLITFQKNIEG